ncbi:hypothetical protein CYMTET_39225 [Cymbomonas tetramitiformis]|uniref:Uncharacterized protein n=1 Tax=Cymbomonas tetramitiformis TaxID=36881 RepID=A0AAE0F456_9CHLO|nr:hypothetical protein CYMTET_39225 [Cymbomonas tetramitiformis]
MGGSNSKEGSSQSEGPKFSVRISQKLLHSIDDKAPVASESSSELGAPLERPSWLPSSQIPYSPLPSFPQDSGADSSLQPSVRKGNMLIKAESEELPKVKGLVDELLEREYRPPERPPPCSTEREACLSCYLTNPQEPFKCSPMVDAFSACAKNLAQATA